MRSSAGTRWPATSVASCWRQRAAGRFSSFGSGSQTGPEPWPSWRLPWVVPASTSRTWRFTRPPTCARVRSRSGSPVRRQPSARSSSCASSATRSRSRRNEPRRDGGSLMERRFEPAGPLRGTLRPPPDKSISHRAALIAAMAEGRSLVLNYLDSADTRSTLAAVTLLGARIEEEESRAGGLELAIRGIGLRRPGDGRVGVGNAGTLLRLLPGWLAGGEGGTWTLDGDESIRRRPVDRIAEPLRRLGAHV